MSDVRVVSAVGSVSRCGGPRPRTGTWTERAAHAVVSVVLLASTGCVEARTEAEPIVVARVRVGAATIEMGSDPADSCRRLLAAGGGTAALASGMDAEGREVALAARNCHLFCRE